MINIKRYYGGINQNSQFVNVYMYKYPDEISTLNPEEQYYHILINKFAISLYLVAKSFYPPPISRYEVRKIKITAK